MTSLNFSNRNMDVYNSSGSNLNLRNIEINSNSPPHGSNHIVSNTMRTMPVSFISSTDACGAPGWQVMMLDETSKRMANQMSSFLIVADKIVLLTQSGEHYTGSGDNRNNYVTIKEEDIAASVRNNPLPLPLNRSMLYTLLPDSVLSRNQQVCGRTIQNQTSYTFQGMTLVTEIPQSQNDTKVVLPPIPSFDIDTEYASSILSHHTNRSMENINQDSSSSTGGNDHNNALASLSKSNYETTGMKKNRSSNNRKIKNHNNTHKRYTCVYCHKELFNSTGLRHHTYTHTNEWPFRCHWPGCVKGTATKRDLVKHQRTHTGEKPFTCDICKKKFTQSGVMHRHRKMCAKKNMINDKN